MIATLQTPTPDLAESRIYYEMLDFQILLTEPAVWVTDGRVLLCIDSDRYARPGVRLYDSDWALTARELARRCPVLPIEGGYLVGAPSGVWVYLLEGEPPVRLPAERGPGSRLGEFAGVSIETLDPVRSFAFWEELGFRQTSGSVEQGWLGLQSADGFQLSLMRALQCPHLFPNPSLTYFNGKDNPAIIDRLRNLGVPILEDIAIFNPQGTIDNVLLCDPGGIGCFVFND